MILIPRDDYIRKGLGGCLVCMLIFFLSGIPCRGRGSIRPDSVSISVSLPHIRHSILIDSAAGLLGKKVSVSGIANIATGLLHEHYMQVYIQNNSAGISLFSDSFDKPISPGDSVVATGTVQQYLGLTEIYVEDYKVFTGGFLLPEPLQFREVIRSPEKYEGMLISGPGVIRAKGNRHNGKFLMVAPVDTSRRSLMIYVSNFHDQYGKFDFEKLSVGDEVHMTGILSRFQPDSYSQDIFRVFLRTPSDLEYRGIPKFYMWLIILMVSVISVLVMGWIFSLKSQVGKQTHLIRSSLKEKEVLLQEIHHRVKNNLAIISGLIELQLDSTSDEAALRVLKDSQFRIHSMAMVHEKLYKSINLSSIDIDVYVTELVEAIRQTFISKHKDIEIDFRLEPVKLGVKQVIPCGLLINELVVNAFKHAFKNTGAGRLVISFKQQGEMAELTVADNGPGLPENFAPDQSGSLGMMLIHTFATQLSAEMKLERDDGTSFSFRFYPDAD